MYPLLCCLIMASQRRKVYDLSTVFGARRFGSGGSWQLTTGATNADGPYVFWCRTDADCYNLRRQNYDNDESGSHNWVTTGPATRVTGDAMVCVQTSSVTRRELSCTSSSKQAKGHGYTNKLDRTGDA